jgi:predicted acylesterase/phospholipase RssA
MAQWMSKKHLATLRERVTPEERRPRRALALGGGGPAVGISLGFLLALEQWNQQQDDDGQPERKIEFPVWATGCVGGWLACLYHLCAKPGQASQVEKQIRVFFREPDMYKHFPCPTTFTPDIPAQIAAGLKYLIDPGSYRDLVVPKAILQAYRDILDYHLKPSKWNLGDFNFLMLNSVLAPNPASRLLMSLLYKSDVSGLNSIWFGPDYSLLKQFDLAKLSKRGVPHIYINSYNLEWKRSELYTNHVVSGAKPPAKPITMPALCASSALPYILTPVAVDGEKHIDGALIDSFCFEAIHCRHNDINEVWISQIVDHSQVKAPANLLEALNNLIMIYAGTTSRHDIEIFVHDVNRHEHFSRLVDARHEFNPIEIFRLPVEPSTNYFWDYDNLDNSIARSKANCLAFIKKYARGISAGGTRKPSPENFFVRSRQFENCD